MREVLDDSDLATVREEQHRELALKARRQEGPQFTGYCAFCGADLEFPRSWCDADCRDAWQREVDAKSARAYV